MTAIEAASHVAHRLCADGLEVIRNGRRLLSDIRLQVHPGEVLALVGPNGAGKSTLLSLLSGAKPSAGSVRLEGRALPAWDARCLARRRAVMPQREPDGFPMTVIEAVLIGRHPHVAHRETAQDLAIVATALAEVGATHLLERQLDTLSGGERQRVRIARALAQLAPGRNHLEDRDSRESRFLLLDEPCAGLDLAQARSLHALLRRQAEHGVGVVVVEHDLALAALADRVGVLSAGRLVALGAPRETLTRQTLRGVFGLDGALITTPSGGLALDLSPPRHRGLAPTLSKETT